MQRDLMAEEIVSDLGPRAAPLAASEYITIKAARSVQIGDVVGK